MPIPISGIIYAFSGFVVTVFTLKIIQQYRKTGSEFSYYLIITSIGLAIGEFLWGLSLIFFQNNQAIAIFFFIATTFIFIALIFAFLAALTLSNISNWRFIFAIILLITIIYLFWLYSNPINPFVDKFGIVHWRLPFLVAVVGFILNTIMTFFPGLIFLAYDKFYSEKISSKTFIRKMLFAEAFLFAGFGGGGIIIFSTTLIDNTPLIVFSSGLQFIGFLLLLIMLEIRGNHGVNYEEEPKNELRTLKCVPCKEGTQPMTKERIDEYLPRLKTDWEVLENKKIKKIFKFNNFEEAMTFVNQISEIAGLEGHYPTIYISYNEVAIELTTHAVGGLSKNDFILAAKIENLQEIKK